MKNFFSIGIAIFAVNFCLYLVADLPPGGLRAPKVIKYSANMNRKTGTFDLDQNQEYSEGSPATEVDSTTFKSTPSQNAGRHSTGVTFKSDVEESPTVKIIDKNQKKQLASPLSMIDEASDFDTESLPPVETKTENFGAKSSNPLFDQLNGKESLDRAKKQLFDKSPIEKQLVSKTPLKARNKLFEDPLEDQQPLATQSEQMVRGPKNLNHLVRTPKKTLPLDLDGASPIEPIIPEKISGPILDKMKKSLDSNQTLIAGVKRLDGSNYMIASKVDVKKGYFKNKTTETIEIIEFDNSGNPLLADNGTPIKISLPVGEYNNRLKSALAKKNKQATISESEQIIDDITYELLGKNSDVMDALKNTNAYKQHKDYLTNKILAPSALNNSIGAINTIVRGIASINLSKFLRNIGSKVTIKKPLDKIGIGVRKKNEWEKSRSSTASESMLSEGYTFYTFENAIADMEDYYRNAMGKSSRYQRD